MSRRKNPSSVDIQKVLLDMREFRMGLIQTPDQLRFSYMAVIEGARLILADNAEAQVDISRQDLFGGKKVFCSGWWYKFHLINKPQGQWDRLLYNEPIVPSIVNRSTLWDETKFTKGSNWTARAGKAVRLEWFMFLPQCSIKIWHWSHFNNVLQFIYQK